jgi:hypothetical protein
MNIPNIYDTCKVGNGAECCRYLSVSERGFECLKLTELKFLIDNKVIANEMNAIGDNCDGTSETISPNDI